MADIEHSEDEEIIETSRVSRNWSLFNVLLLGFSFMLLFTAFQTCSMVEILVLDGVRNESNGTFIGDGYTSQSIIYGTFAGANWIAPSVVAFIGTKWSMFAGASFYCLFIASFLKPMVETLYVGSALVGIGAAVLWTAQGSLLIINSTTETMSRNAGIFWAMFQSSILIGNIYIYFAFAGQTVILSSTRTKLFIVLTIAGVLGTLLMLGFRRLNVDQSSHPEVSAPQQSPLQAFKRAVRLLFTKEMAFLCVLFAYNGLETSFWASIYITSVGHTMSFGLSAKQLTGLCGVLVGVGEIVGGALFGVLGNKLGRDLLVLIGYVIHIVVFFLIFLNIPDDSPLHDTDELAYITPNKYLAVACAFLLGLGDSSFSTQIYPIIGALFPTDSAPAFALYKFIQSLASAMVFIYSHYLLLQWHLLILVVMATAGTLLFFGAERLSERTIRVGYVAIQSSTVEGSQDLTED